jgi:hypothetical protein
MSDGVADAAGLAATGLGLGILTMGAMIPIKIMKKSLKEVEENEKDEKPKKRGNTTGIVLPKIRVTPMKVPRKEPYEFDAKIVMPAIKINYPTMKGMKNWKF